MRGGNFLRTWIFNSLTNQVHYIARYLFSLLHQAVCYKSHSAMSNKSYEPIIKNVNWMIWFL